MYRNTSSGYFVIQSFPGNKWLHLLTLTDVELLVNLTLADSQTRQARYRIFRVGEAADNYTLQIHSYFAGDAGGKKFQIWKCQK